MNLYYRFIIWRMWFPLIAISLMYSYNEVFGCDRSCQFNIRHTYPLKCLFGLGANRYSKQYFLKNDSPGCHFDSITADIKLIT